MPVINLKSINKQQVETVYTYRDLSLDINENNITTDVGLYREPTSTDIEISYDEAAIKNSLTNLFSTMPGQKLLNPDYGLNFAQFLFIPASESMARMIGNRILEGVQKYESRVKVVNVNVTVDEDAAEYMITLTVKIPKLNNSSVSFTGMLASTGFSFQ